MRRMALTIASCFALAGLAAAQAEQAPAVDRQAAAAAIDRLVLAHLAAQQKSALPAADDATFLRRAWLGLAGRIPTAAEARAFLESKAPDKRDQLVRELLARPSFASHFFHFWADLLRIKTRITQRASGEPYIHWLREALAENRPYDVMVRQLLTAEGAAHARGQGATGYVLRDFEMPEDNMANTVRVFLGTRLECAQCHNHPSDKWTQRQFFEMAAFAGGVQYRAQANPRDLALRPGPYREAAQEIREKHGQEGLQALFLTLRNSAVSVVGSGTGLARLPNDYQYDDAKPMSWISARTIFGQEVKVDAQPPVERRRGRAAPGGPAANRLAARAMQVPAIGSREAFAAWVTSDENPRFALVIANRLWAEVFGRGLIEPLDDLKDDTVPVAPELLAELERLMIALDYDLKAFLEILWTTDAAQRATFGEDLPGEAAVLTGMPLRRMSAEQLWDSLLTLVVPDLDGTLGPALSPRAEAVYAQYERLRSATPEELVALVDLQMLRRKDPAAYRRALRERMEEDGAAARERSGERAALEQRLREARRAKDFAEIAKIRAEIARYAALAGIGGNNALLRASDLPQPAPPGHFLRQFGQSDRETIEGAYVDPSVPQALQLLNGFLEERVLRDDAGALALELRAAKKPDAIVRAAYLGLLSREPTPEELKLWTKEARALGQGFGPEIVWTLANLHEFRFIR